MMIIRGSLGPVSFRPTIFRSGMANRFVKDCRVGRKNCALLAMTKLVGFMKNLPVSKSECFNLSRSDNTQKITAKIEKRPFSKLKRSNFVSLRGRFAAVAIFKSKVWHPVAKHGSTKRQNFNPSRSDTGTALPRKRHFTRAQARVSRAKHLSLGQRPIHGI